MALPTIHDVDLIAERARAAVNAVYKEQGWDDPPKVSSGLVTEVLKATEDVTGEPIVADRIPASMTP